MRIAALALLCATLTACVSTPTPSDQTRVCEVLSALTTQNVHAYLEPDLDRRMQRIENVNLEADTVCGATTFPRNAPVGLSFAGVGFSADGGYAAVRTHFQGGPDYVFGSRCLLRQVDHAWRLLGCTPQYMS